MGRCRITRQLKDTWDTSITHTHWTRGHMRHVRHSTILDTWATSDMSEIDILTRNETNVLSSLVTDVDPTAVRNIFGPCDVSS